MYSTVLQCSLVRDIPFGERTTTILPPPLGLLLTHPFVCNAFPDIGRSSRGGGDGPILFHCSAEDWKWAGACLLQLSS